MKRSLSIKKQMIGVILFSIITGFPACGEGRDSADAMIPDQKSEVGEGAADNKTEAERYIYGAAEIPDISCGNNSLEGKADLSPASEDSVRLRQALDCMVFETHTFGDYTVSLVGDSVRTDEANFPGSIYTQKLRVEVEKNGVKLEGSGFYNDTVVYVSQLAAEYRLFADKIGSYLDVYGLECPVIAMRYYFDGDSESAVTKAVEFATIQDDELCSGFAGMFVAGTGIMINPDGDAAPKLITNDADNGTCRIGIFDADEFMVVDGITLTDETAGIQYTFHFSDPPQFELYTVETVK